MTITFIGHGYVGLVTASVFADLGNKVYVVGHTPEKIEKLKKGMSPFYEPGLEEMVKRNIDAGRLIPTLDFSEAVPDAEIVFIAVGTPPQKTGDAELSGVFTVAEEIAKNLSGYTVVVTKSTVPVGTNKRIQANINDHKKEGVTFDVASNPEFLKEGTAIEDTLHPDRIVIGTENDEALKVLKDLHAPFDAPILETNLETAELIKYASNCFLANKISFANAIAKLAELTGADASRVLDGVGYDKRIGRQFLYPGPGYGGSCLPKDVRALQSLASDYGYDFGLLSEVENINRQAKRDLVRKAKAQVGDLRKKKVAILGLAFKANTDDMREAPSIDVSELLRKEGAEIYAYDPQAQENAKGVMPHVKMADSLYDAVKGASLVMILTDWDEFKEADLEKVKDLMEEPNIVDGRNIYSKEKLEKLGFNYIGVGK